MRPMRGVEGGRQLAERARASRAAIAAAPTRKKDAVLMRLARLLHERTHALIDANERDMQAARARGVSAALLDRLLLTDERVAGLIRAVQDVAALPDPVGEVVAGRRLLAGPDLVCRRVPLGVVLVIYEARPNVTIDAAALALKSGNALILRGGTDALHTNHALANAVSAALEGEGLPGDAVVFVTQPEREVLLDLITHDDLIDVVIPRGGEALKKLLSEHSRVPVIAAAGGNCHVYVDASADLAMAERIVLNAKTQRPGVCNAAETLLVHEAVAATFVPKIVGALRAKNVALYLDGAALAYLDERARAGVGAATEEHFAREFLGLEMAVGVVPSHAAAVAHINRFGTGHSEAIVTGDVTASRRFADEVDAAVVYVNASTRLTDGAVFGLGAEIGISTQKLHVRGPIGLAHLTTTQYVVTGSGEIR